MRSRRNDEMNWNRTASLMSILAQVNAKKGKTFSPADFHPYLKGGAKDGYKIETKEDVYALAEKFKKIDGIN